MCCGFVCPRHSIGSVARSTDLSKIYGFLGPNNLYGWIRENSPILRIFGAASFVVRECAYPLTVLYGCVHTHYLELERRVIACTCVVYVVCPVSVVLILVIQPKIVHVMNPTQM